MSPPQMHMLKSNPQYLRTLPYLAIGSLWVSLIKMRSHWRRADPSSNMTAAFKSMDIWTQKRSHREGSRLRAKERGLEQPLPSRPSGGSNPVDPWTSVFSLQLLLNHGFVVLGYKSPRKPRAAPPPPGSPRALTLGGASYHAGPATSRTSRWRGPTWRCWVRRQPHPPDA